MKILKNVFPFLWVGFWIVVFVWIAGPAVKEAPLYLSLPVVIVVVLLSVAELIRLGALE